MDPFGLDQPTSLPAAPSTSPVRVGMRWPTKDELDYAQKAITVLLLALALPWLAYKLVTNPSYVFAGAGRRHVKGS